MEPGSKIKKTRVTKIALDHDEDEYPGILPCHGREGGLYPGVRHQHTGHQHVQDWRVIIP